MAIPSKSVQGGLSITARILVTAGKTDRLEYQLTKPSNLIGSQDGAAIRLTGWFAPKPTGWPQYGTSRRPPPCTWPTPPEPCAPTV